MPSDAQTAPIIVKPHQCGGTAHLGCYPVWINRKRVRKSQDQNIVDQFARRLCAACLVPCEEEAHGIAFVRNIELGRARYRLALRHLP